MTVFEGCQVTLELDSSLGFKKKTELKKKIIDNGGIISFIVTKKVSELCYSLNIQSDLSSALDGGLPLHGRLHTAL